MQRLPFDISAKVVNLRFVGKNLNFGELIELYPNSKKIITEYLKVNAAEYSSAKQPVKIMRSLGNRIPLRMT